MADAFDYQGSISGVSGAHPQLVPRGLASNAVNRSFRYDRNATRNPFVHIQLEFENDADRFLFEGGNFQGATFYNAYPSTGQSCLIAAIAGTIFRIRISGRIGVVERLLDGNDPVLTHTWYAQGFEWLVIQNGYNEAIVWNGTDDARRASADQQEVPIGSVMAFIHGRLAVASADGTNQIAVGDIVYGNTQTDTSDIIRFTETGYWAEGGAFGAPVYVGDLTGMYAMPYLDTGTGQNELVVLGTEGAIALDLSRSRTQWLDSQLIRISLIGGGNVSPYSLAALNGDLFFRSTEGVRSYKNARSEFAQTWKQTPISSDVRRWINTDSPRLLQYNSQASWNNFLFSTCSPQLERANNLYAGHHRFHRGFVVMDMEPESNSVRSGAPVWQGMWTGIRPTQFVTGRLENEDRCFAFSYDRDGVNRLYEITREGTDDIFNSQPVKIFSYYDTASLGVVQGTSGILDVKNVLGGELELSNLREEVETSISIRPDSSPCFVEVENFRAGCDCRPRECGKTFSQPRWFRKIFSANSRVCDPSTGKTATNVKLWQGRVRMTGSATVEMLAFRFSPQPIPTATNCWNDSCQPVSCCPDADAYSYHVAPEGVNLNIPDLPVPSDVPALYQSIKTYTAKCPPGSYGIERSYTATSFSNISQGDADQKALDAARDAAEALLDCVTCNPQTVLEFEMSESETFDLSGYFELGFASGLEGRTWRLVDGYSLMIYATGRVDTQGTLGIVYASEPGDVYLDTETFIFHDISPTSAPVYLQIACPTPNGDVFPTIEGPYYS